MTLPAGPGSIAMRATSPTTPRSAPDDDEFTQSSRTMPTYEEYEYDDGTCSSYSSPSYSDTYDPFSDYDDDATYVPTRTMPWTSPRYTPPPRSRVVAPPVPEPMRPRTPPRGDDCGDRRVDHHGGDDHDLVDDDDLVDDHHVDHGAAAGGAGLEGADDYPRRGVRAGQGRLSAGDHSTLAGIGTARARSTDGGATGRRSRSVAVPTAYGRSEPSGVTWVATSTGVSEIVAGVPRRAATWPASRR